MISSQIILLEITSLPKGIFTTEEDEGRGEERGRVARFN
jgi:hypothetical protein